MAKAKRKPDFSKPKSEKKAVEQNQTELFSDNEAEVSITEDSDEVLEGIEEYKAEVKNAGYDLSKYYVNLPLVVIAGRPNVGKSTLFNRFMHRRLAIVDPTPGVTRDPVEANAFIYGKPVRLVDTGGYKLDRDLKSRESEMDELVVQKTLASIKQADKILLLLEAGTITGEDEEFINLLRPYWDKLIVAVNKCEVRPDADLGQVEAKVKALHGTICNTVSRNSFSFLQTTATISPNWLKKSQTGSIFQKLRKAKNRRSQLELQFLESQTQVNPPFQTASPTVKNPLSLTTPAQPAM